MVFVANTSAKIQAPESPIESSFFNMENEEENKSHIHLQYHNGTIQLKSNVVMFVLTLIISANVLTSSSPKLMPVQQHVMKMKEFR